MFPSFLFRYCGAPCKMCTSYVRHIEDFAVNRNQIRVVEIFGPKHYHHWNFFSAAASRRTEWPSYLNRLQSFLRYVVCTRFVIRSYFIAKRPLLFALGVTPSRRYQGYGLRLIQGVFPQRSRTGLSLQHTKAKRQKSGEDDESIH